MKDLIEALTILHKYGNPNYPTHCEHDVLMVDINPELVPYDDKVRLHALGFFPYDSCGEHCFASYRFGSC